MGSRGGRGAPFQSGSGAPTGWPCSLRWAPLIATRRRKAEGGRRKDGCARRASGRSSFHVPRSSFASPLLRQPAKFGDGTLVLHEVARALGLRRLEEGQRAVALVAHEV